MHLLNNGFEQPKNPLALELIRYRILGKPYSSWRALIASTGNSDTDFLICIKELFGIVIDKKADPMLYITQDTQQMRLLKESGAENPSMLQILLTSKVMSLTEEGAKERMEELLRELSQNEEVATS